MKLPNLILVVFSHLLFLSSDLFAQSDSLSSQLVSSAIVDSSKTISETDSCHLFAEYVYKLFLDHNIDSLKLLCNVDCVSGVDRIYVSLLNEWPLKSVLNYQDTSRLISNNNCLFSIDVIDEKNLDLRIRITIYQGRLSNGEMLISKITYKRLNMPELNIHEFNRELQRKFYNQIEYRHQQDRRYSPR
ncbi:MAG: hypothetical protein IM638_08940 [Bacteroidetes bacterium]|nr:hypothetical protein [Bacteroidota bacterium]